MRKKFWCLSIIAVICLSLAIVGCGGKEELKVSITNKTALTAEWTEGEADRTIEFSLTPESYTVDNTEVTVMSDNSGVVRVDGMKLIASGGGNATVTIKAGDASDSVKIAVKSKKTGLSITNKAEISDLWAIGDADREIKAVFNTTGDSAAAENITAVSTDPTIVEVNGLTLKAKATGSCTISVSGENFTDTVNVAVRPQLTSFTITNKSELEVAWLLGENNRAITIAYEPSQHYTQENTTPTVECLPAGILDVINGGYELEAKKPGTATVTVKVRDKQDTFTVTVDYGMPKVTINSADSNFVATDDGGKLGVLEGEAITLPTVRAMTTDGINLTSDITVTYPAEAVKDNSTGKYTFPKGTFNITYSVSDKRDASKTTVKTIKVYASKKILIAGGGNGPIGSSWTSSVDLAAATPDADNPVARTTNNEFAYAQFNIAASKNYYAEATFKVTDPTRNNMIGMAHFTGTGAQSRFLAGIIDRGETGHDITQEAERNKNGRNHKTADFYTTGSNAWALQETPDWAEPHNPNVLYSSQIVDFRGLTDSNASEATYAIARIGDFFYQFINGQCINGVNWDYYASKDTIPGLFGYGLNNCAVSNIFYASGNDATAKIDEVFKKGAGTISAYSPADWSHKSTEKGAFTVGNTTQEKGINYAVSDPNRGPQHTMVSTWQYFGGDFTFSFDYKVAGVNQDAGGWLKNMMLFAVRPWNFGDEIVRFGADYNTDVSFKSFCFASDKGFDATLVSDNTTGGFDTTKGINFTLSRKLFDDRAEYTMKITSINNSAQNITKLATVSKTAYSRFADPVITFWYNSGVSGEYTNISWAAGSPAA